MRIGGVTGMTGQAFQRMFGTDKNRNPGIPEPPCDECELPGELEINNPSSPTSWYKGITKLLDKARELYYCAQRKFAGSITGTNNDNPQSLLVLQFIGASLMGFLQDLFKSAIELAKTSRKELKELDGLASPS